MNATMRLWGLWSTLSRTATIAALLVAMPAMAQISSTPAPRPPDRGQVDPATTTESPLIIYSPWRKFCVKDPRLNPKQVCLTGRDARFESGEIAANVVIMELEEEAQKFLRLMLPLGMALRYGTRIIIDQGEHVAAPYVACYSTGCIADYEVNAEMIAGLKKGEQLIAQAVVSATGKPIGLPVLLAGFATAYDGPPIDLKSYEELQRQLQEVPYRLDDQLIRCEGAVGAAACAVKRFHDKSRQ